MSTITLTLDNGQEDQEVRRSHGTKSLRQTRITRMAEEAIDQGGVLIQEDLSDLPEVDVRTIRRDIQVITEKGVRVQTRGPYHDIGPTLCQLVLAISNAFGNRPDDQTLDIIHQALPPRLWTRGCLYKERVICS